MLKTTKTSLIALLLSAPIAAAPVLAEQHTSGSDSDTTQSADTEMPTAEGQDGSSVAAGTDGEEQADPLLATVGDAEITAADVEAALSAFPAQIRQSQPVEMLIPMAMEQLILRELILQAAMDENMADDEDVEALLDENNQRTEEDAMVQVYVERELEGAVTDQAVQDTYDEVASNSQTEVPPLDAVRPQIEQQLRQQRLNEMGEALQEGVEIVYYGPDGEPQEAASQDEGTMSDDATGTGSTSTSDDGATSVEDNMPDNSESSSSN
ncbi:hypothetical protein PARPLA_01105 [Rhodobacteraceae bacterium THAF1]|uniref:hypothetical protein n=1 Tax=Palleronia sp. THAF1 TaxID=2587842 RepID=UPI000F3CC470|nr:hypothetical protein [Palleronia sp. THAF1]QFU07372.1 hypothetical protein FIU81_01655 [Palleronia sp. THAF1]VDC20716.1 hypothetical protein PARPLA_01105 [Rhodobacteraceae bacterium THAF1]